MALEPNKAPELEVFKYTTSCAFKKKLKKVVHFENKFVYLVEFQTVKYNEQPCTKLQNNFK